MLEDHQIWMKTTGQEAFGVTSLLVYSSPIRVLVDETKNRFEPRWVVTVKFDENRPTGSG